MRRHNYTILELLFVIGCISILSSMLMPAFNESREKTRFVRWIGFNKQCSDDPSCVINFNFQEGQGSILTNSAAGHENNKFNVKDYYGIVKNGTVTDSNGSWKTMDGKWVNGRWWKGKRALQFNGLNTLVEIPQIEAIDFSEQDDFTIIVWMKFDKFTNWSTPFCKSYAPDFAQYDLYLDNTAYSTSSAKAQFEVDVCRTCVGYDNILINHETGDTTPNIALDTDHWYMLALRNRAAKTPASVSPDNINDHVVDVLWNGQNMAVGRGTNNVTATGTPCGAKLILGVMRFTTGQNEGEGRLDFMNTGFAGKIDEFIIYKRALSDIELRGHYAMGAEHL